MPDNLLRTIGAPALGAALAEYLSEELVYTSPVGNAVTVRATPAVSEFPAESGSNRVHVAVMVHKPNMATAPVAGGSFTYRGATYNVISVKSAGMADQFYRITGHRTT